MELYYALLGLLPILAVYVAYRFFHIPFWNVTLAALSGVLAVAIFAWPVAAISYNITKDSDQTYTEYWGGHEQAAVTDIVACERDGRCDNTYSCDPYTYTWVETYTDSDGKTQTRTRSETRYHSCPYSSEETEYIVNTTFGPYPVATLMTGPEYRPGKGIPGGQQTEPPALWTAAAERIANGEPGGVFKSNQYKNYLHASSETISRLYSEDIDMYTEKGVLPSIQSGQYDIYRMDKALYPKNTILNEAHIETTRKEAEYLSAALGSERQGDLRVVFVPERIVSEGEAEKYGLTLMAYWASEDMDRYATPKNAVVVIVGVSGTKTEPTAEWTRAYTGMPLGNEMMLSEIERKLDGQPIEAGFLGQPQFAPDTGKVKNSGGELENILFGSNGFQRVSMSGTTPDDYGSGYEYLSEEWQPDAGQALGIFWWSFGFSFPFFLFGCIINLVIGLERRSYGEYPDWPVWLDPIRHLAHKY